MSRRYARTVVVYNTTLLLVAYIFFPAPAFAQAVSTVWFNTFITQSGTLVNATMPVLIALAFFVLLWGIVKFISASGNEAKIEDGKQKMMWGVISLFVIVSVWGILTLLRGVTGVGDKKTANYPSWRE